MPFSIYSSILSFLGLWYDYAMKTFKQLALIGPTASGKTALSIKIAQQMNAYILSLDSLSIYKEIDIVSAKPTLEERAGIEHFGMDYLYPDESFDVTTFIKLYHEVHAKCLEDKKNLVIVGGTSFYLKMLMEGISELPTISNETKEKAHSYLQDLQKTYAWLYTLDETYMSNIELIEAVCVMGDLWGLENMKVKNIKRMSESPNGKKLIQKYYGKEHI